MGNGKLPLPPGRDLEEPFSHPLSRTFPLLPRQKRSTKLWAFRRRVVLALGGLPCDIPDLATTSVERRNWQQLCWKW